MDLKKTKRWFLHTHTHTSTQQISGYSPSKNFEQSIKIKQRSEKEEKGEMQKLEEEKNKENKLKLRMW